MRRTSFAAAVCGGLVVLTACTTTVTGTASPAEPAVATPTATTPPAPVPVPPTSTQLAAAVVQQADLPAGWRTPADAADTSGADDVTIADFVSCLGFRDTGDMRAGTAVSPIFDHGGGLEVDSVAASYPAQQYVEEHTGALGDPRASDCFGSALRKDIESQAQSVKATVGAGRFTVTLGTGGGPADVVATGTGSFAVTTQRGHGTIFVDYVFLAGRLTEARVAFLSVGSRVPTAVRTSVVAAVARRVAAL